jgi:hypothetical protein
VDEPTTPELIRVKSRISAELWRRRVEQAQRDEPQIRAILDEVAAGTSLNVAIAKVLPANRRSWALRRIPAYREQGFEALIDSRTPREPEVSVACRQVVQTAREVNPRVTVNEALEILRKQKISPLPSESTIKREFSRVDERRKYARRKAARAGDAVKVIDLPLAGGELLAAAETETGGIAALTDEVVQIAEQATAASVGQTPVKDVARRSARGQFTVTYNRARRRKRGEEVASYLRMAEEKAEGRVPSWPRFVHEQPETIDAKLRMLVSGWMVVGSKGWDALRAPDVAGLESLTGFAYMPSTLAKFVSALAISGAAQPLIEAVGRRWHEVAQERWQEPGAMAALYIDNHTKEVWSSLFTQSGKVARHDRATRRRHRRTPEAARSATHHPSTRRHPRHDPDRDQAHCGDAHLLRVARVPAIDVDDPADLCSARPHCSRPQGDRSRPGTRRVLRESSRPARQRRAQQGLRTTQPAGATPRWPATPLHRRAAASRARPVRLI